MTFNTQSKQDEYDAMRASQDALYASLEGAAEEDKAGIKAQIRQSKVDCAQFVRENRADLV